LNQIIFCKGQKFSVQQEIATHEDNRMTSRKRKVFIPLRVFLLYM
jgi:hypothetical protein